MLARHGRWLHSPSFALTKCGVCCQGTTTQLFDVLAAMPSLQQASLAGLTQVSGMLDQTSALGNGICSHGVSAVPASQPLVEGL